MSDTPPIVKAAMARLADQFSKPPEPLMPQEEFDKLDEMRKSFLTCNMPGCGKMVSTHHMLCVEHHNEMDQKHPMYMVMVTEDGVTTVSIPKTDHPGYVIRCMILDVMAMFAKDHRCEATHMSITPDMKTLLQDFHDKELKRPVDLANCFSVHLTVDSGRFRVWREEPVFRDSLNDRE